MRTVRDALESAAPFRHKINAIRRLLAWCRFEAPRCHSRRHWPAGRFSYQL